MQLCLSPLTTIPSNESNSQPQIQNVNTRGCQAIASFCSLVVSFTLSSTHFHASDRDPTSADAPQFDKKIRETFLWTDLFTMCRALGCAFYYLHVEEVVV